MSASTGTTSPTTLPALSPNDVILQHVMTLIGDDGTVFDILQHVGVQSPLDLFMYDENDFATMKAKINNITIEKLSQNHRRGMRARSGMLNYVSDHDLGGQRWRP